uniref:nucleoside-diphosphate kinase n=1 Tax=Acrobeloides nanus TaxID=290746 RepID=A0A914EDW0_9BILA
MPNTSERTFIIIKPDGVQRNFIGKIVQRFEERGYKLVGMKLVCASKDHWEFHYQDLKESPFFPDLIKYLQSGPVVAMVWEGLDAIRQGRAMLGSNPLYSNPGTIRGDYCTQTGHGSVIHGSDSVDASNREISHWFKQDELVDYELANKCWLYE